MVFSEYSRSGIPIAAMSWRDGTSADQAINNDLGKIVKCNGKENDNEIALKLSIAIEESSKLNRSKVFNLGNIRYNPKNLTEDYIKTLSS